jgi:hypothetical protein
MAVTFRVNPKTLANTLHNALTMAKGRKPLHPFILLRYNYNWDQGKGELTAVGVSQYSAGVDWCSVEAGTEDGYAEIRLLGVNPEKTDVIDDLTKLASAIRSTSAAKDALVTVTIDHKQSITVEYGADLLGELGDADEYDVTAGMENHPGIFDKVEELIYQVNDCGAPDGPVAFNLDIIARCKDLKVTGTPADSGVMDLAAHPDPTKNLVGVAVGPNFRGLVASIDRAVYAKGGPWNDGPGEPSHLLGS